MHKIKSKHSNIKNTLSTESNEKRNFILLFSNKKFRNHI